MRRGNDILLGNDLQDLPKLRHYREVVDKNSPQICDQTGGIQDKSSESNGIRNIAMQCESFSMV